jgi:nicotinate-nucleotide adenylyltransferase
MINCIGLLGGTFDPIHEGHLRMAQIVMDQFPLDTIHFIPCKLPVLDKTTQTPANDRLAMLDLALAQHANWQSDPREVNRDTPSYMVDTLQSYYNEDSTQHCCLILGLDAFLQLPKWHQWEKLFSLCHLIVIHRDQKQWSLPPELTEHWQQRKVSDPQQIREQQSGLIYYLSDVALPISSTDIRTQLREGNAPSSVPNVVLEYIQQHRLYQQT